MCNFCGASDDTLVLEAGPSGIVIVDESPLVIGHLLVVSNSHAPSMAELPIGERFRMLNLIGRTRHLSERITGVTSIAVEHGRSPTCNDTSGAVHAHVHVLPVGALDQSLLEMWDAISPVEGPTEGPYLSILTDDPPLYWQFNRSVPHAARSLGSLVASSNGHAWKPLSAGPDSRGAWITKTAAKPLAPYLLPDPRDRTPNFTPRSIRPTVAISGPTGSGKTTVGAFIAHELGVPAIELGVMLRLVCLNNRPRTDKELASLLWRWKRSGSMDFEARSSHGLAAAVPRLNGKSDEVRMWTHVDSQRLADLARGDETQEVLDCIASSVAAQHGAVIIGRIPSSFSGGDIAHLRLHADSKTRAQRKRKQLTAIGLTSEAHDWFNPSSILSPSDQDPDNGRVLDTSNLAMGPMAMSALSVARRDDRCFGQAVGE